MRQRVRRNGGGGGCSEGCWQHRLLSRCYIEWVDEYLRRSTSCGFFFNQANLLRSPLPPCLLLPPLRTPAFPFPLLAGFRLLELWREASQAVYAESEISKKLASLSTRSCLARLIFLRVVIGGFTLPDDDSMNVNLLASQWNRRLTRCNLPRNQIPPSGPLCRGDREFPAN